VHRRQDRASVKPRLEVPLARLVALATLPYIIKLEGGRVMDVEDDSPQGDVD
jgi:hypothetical protein